MPVDLTSDPYDALPPALRIARVRTPMDADTVRSAMMIGYREVTGEDASYDLLASACAMVGVEHAADVVKGGPVIWGGAIWCNCIGNIGVGKGAGKWLGEFFDLTADELLNGVRRKITQPLRAHSNAVSGAADYWSFLLQPRFAKAIESMTAGNTDDAAHDLKEQRYYTALVEDYAKALRDWTRMYHSRWPR